MLLLTLLAVVTRSADDDASLTLDTAAKRQLYFLNNTPNAGDIQRMLSVDHPEMFACTSPLVSHHALTQLDALPGIQTLTIDGILLSIAAGCDMLAELTVASQWEQILHEISARESEFRSRFPLLNYQELPTHDYDPRQLDRKAAAMFDWADCEADRVLHRAHALAHGHETVVHKAARGGHAALLRWCAQDRASFRVNEWAGKARTPLHLAAAAGQACAVRELLAAGGDPLATDSNDATPLHYAARGGSLEAVRMLVDAVRATGKQPMSADYYGSTPVDLADAGAWPPGATWETKEHNDAGELTDAHTTIVQFLRGEQ